MRGGVTPETAAQQVMNRIIINSPKFFGAIIVLNITGNYGVACNGRYQMKLQFPFWIANPTSGKTLTFFGCSDFV